MYKKIIPIGMAILLAACGGSSENNSAESVNNVTEISTLSSIEVYVANWQLPQGTLNIFDSNNVLQESLKVEDINNVNIKVAALSFYTFEFIPTDTRLNCPRLSGCGRTFRGDVNDLNENRLIDYQEATSVELNYKAEVFGAPGANVVYLSPMSKAITERGFSASLPSLSATPFYHLTHSSLPAKVEAQMVTNAFTYAAIVAGAMDNTFSVENAFEEFIDAETIPHDWQNYSQLATQFITENLISEQDNTQLQSVAGQVKQTIASITTNLEWNTLRSGELSYDSRELLVDIRDIIGVARLQEASSLDTLNTRLEELESAFDESTKMTLDVLVNVLDVVITNYSPVADELIPAGQYEIDGLDIDYNKSPYSWAITGTYDGLAVVIDLTIPNFRISGVLGDRVEGVLSASIINGSTSLNITSSKLLVQLDGTDDSNNQNSDTDTDTDTGIADLTVSLEINKEASQLEGELSLKLKRDLNSLSKVVNILSSFDFNGKYVSNIQSIDFHITALETSPFKGDENDDLVYSFELDFPLNGANDFKFAYAGKIDNRPRLSSSDFFVSLQNRGLDIQIRDIKGNINLVVSGANGRWLELKQKGRDYSGGLYFGDTKIAKVTAVRGIPGVLFPNGDFESLF